MALSNETCKSELRSLGHDIPEQMAFSCPIGHNKKPLYCSVPMEREPEPKTVPQENIYKQYFQKIFGTNRLRMQTVIPKYHRRN